jgi:hypothetical protein
MVITAVAPERAIPSDGIVEEARGHKSLFGGRALDCVPALLALLLSTFPLSDVALLAQIARRMYKYPWIST